MPERRALLENWLRSVLDRDEVVLAPASGDASFRAPMAIVVIGGLITSTFLSLLVIPVVFTFVDDLIVVVRAKLGMQPH